MRLPYGNGLPWTTSRVLYDGALIPQVDRDRVRFLTLFARQTLNGPGDGANGVTAAGVSVSRLADALADPGTEYTVLKRYPVSGLTTVTAAHQGAGNAWIMYGYYEFDDATNVAALGPESFTPALPPVAPYAAPVAVGAGTAVNQAVRINTGSATVVQLVTVDVGGLGEGVGSEATVNILLSQENLTTAEIYNNAAVDADLGVRMLVAGETVFRLLDRIPMLGANLVLSASTNKGFVYGTVQRVD